MFDEINYAPSGRDDRQLELRFPLPPDLVALVEDGADETWIRLLWG